MRLFFSRTSPFAREVQACVIAHRLEGRLELVEARFPDPMPEFMMVNPPCRIPTPVTDDGRALFGSLVICEYLDEVADASPPIPSNAAARWACRRLEALADGLMDNTVVRAQILRAGLGDDNVLIRRHEEGGILRGVDRLGVEVPGTHLDVGAIAVACAFGFSDLRHAELDRRHGRAALAGWFEAMSRTHRGLGETAPPN